jgi:hypothetical protein
MLLIVLAQEYNYDYEFSPALTGLDWGLRLVGVGLCIFVLVDATRRPDWVWPATGQSKALWITLGVLGIFPGCCCGLAGGAIGAVYLAAIRPKLETAQSGGYGGPGSGAFGQGPPPGSGYGPSAGPYGPPPGPSGYGPPPGQPGYGPYPGQPGYGPPPGSPGYGPPPGSPGPGSAPPPPSPGSGPPPAGPVSSPPPSDGPGDRGWPPPPS